MRPNNRWYAHGINGILKIVAHDPFTTWLCHTLRIIVNEARSRAAWHRLIDTLVEFPDQYLAVETEGDLVFCECILTQTRTKYTRLRPEDRALLSPGWSALYQLQETARTNADLPTWREAPYHHPLYLMRTFASACAAGMTGQKRAAALDHLELIVKDIARRYNFGRTPLIREPEGLPIRDLADGMLCMPRYYVGACADTQCPDTQGITAHAHVIPFDWTFWAEPQTDLPTLRSKADAERLLAERFPEGTLSAPCLNELASGIELCNLPD